METTHSKTRRTKGSAPKIVVPSWDDVWKSFDQKNSVISIEAMNAEGWRTVEQVMETSKLSNARIYNMIREGLFEREKKKVKTGGMIKVLNFVRPKV
jgi:hypothetical protein